MLRKPCEGFAEAATVAMPPLHGFYCCITYPDGMGYNTIDGRVFDAAAKALEWVEVDCQSFGTARRYRDDQVLVIGVGMVRDRWCRVRIGSVRRWIRETVLTAKGNRRFVETGGGSQGGNLPPAGLFH